MDNLIVLDNITNIPQNIMASSLVKLWFRDIDFFHLLVLPSSREVLLNWDNWQSLPHMVNLVIFRNTSDYLNWVLFTSNIEARDGSKHHIIHRKAPTMKNYLVSSVYSAEVDKSSPITLGSSIGFYASGQRMRKNGRLPLERL